VPVIAVMEVPCRVDPERLFVGPPRPILRVGNLGEAEPKNFYFGKTDFSAPLRC
jgi:hypothetical protein